MTISIQTKNPMFSDLSPFSSCSCIVVSFKSDPIEKHDFFFAKLVLRQCRYPSCANESSDGFRAFCLAVLPSPCLEKHDLSFRCTVLCSSTRILLNDKAGIEVKSIASCCRTPLVLQISPVTADFREGIAIKTSKFCRILAKFCVVHVDE